MDARYYGLIEMVMMFAIVGGFTAWTFWSLREKPETKHEDRPGEAPAPDKDDEQP